MALVNYKLDKCVIEFGNILNFKYSPQDLMVHFLKNEAQLTDTSWLKIYRCSLYALANGIRRRHGAEAGLVAVLPLADSRVDIADKVALGKQYKKAQQEGRFCGQAA